MLIVSSGVTHSSISALPLTPYLIAVLPHMMVSVRCPSDLSRLQSISPVSICHLPFGTVHGPVDLLGRSAQIGCSSAANAALLHARRVALMIDSPRISLHCSREPVSSRGEGKSSLSSYAAVVNSTCASYCADAPTTGRRPRTLLSTAGWITVRNSIPAAIPSDQQTRDPSGSSCGRRVIMQSPASHGSTISFLHPALEIFLIATWTLKQPTPRLASSEWSATRSKRRRSSPEGAAVTSTTAAAAAGTVTGPLR